MDLKSVPRYRFTVDTTANDKVVEVAMSHQREPGPTAGGSQIVCTLDGGVDVLRERIAQWQGVIGAATDREPADGGITLVFRTAPQFGTAPGAVV
jgi:hypothetical protein